MEATRTRWLTANPYLAPLARLEELVAGAAREVPAPQLELAPLDAYAESYFAGVPLLSAPTHGPMLRGAGADALGGFLDRAVDLELPPSIAEGMAALRGTLTTVQARTDAVAWLVEGGPSAPVAEQVGLLRYAGWVAFRQVLGRVLEAFATWRDDSRWGRRCCPTCGAVPVMAQLVSAGAGRARRLVCGCCSTRWGYRRLGCPFCGNEDAERLGLLELEGPAPIRLDVCEACKGYVKTYTAQGEEALYLLDWPTLFLDTLAAQRGYARRGASLYQL
jgi:FdhE protein